MMPLEIDMRRMLWLRYLWVFCSAGRSLPPWILCWACTFHHFPRHARIFNNFQHRHKGRDVLQFYTAVTRFKVHGLSDAMVTKLWPSETSEGLATLRATQSTWTPTLEACEFARTRFTVTGTCRNLHKCDWDKLNATKAGRILWLNDSMTRVVTCESNHARPSRGPKS